MTTRTTNEHGFVFPAPVLDAQGRPIRPTSQGPRDAFNRSPQPANDNTRAAFPPLGFRDKRLEN
jgi:hypothetical protein